LASVTPGHTITKKQITTMFDSLLAERKRELREINDSIAKIEREEAFQERLQSMKDLMKY
jgi:hypothetical protein